MSFWPDRRSSQPPNLTGGTAVDEPRRGERTRRADVAEEYDGAPLAARARRGAISGGMAQGLQQALSVGATLVLTRILSPEDFGIVAAATTLLGLSTLLLAMGIGAAVVSRPVLTPAWLATMFWSAVTLGGLVSLVFLGSAPLLARLFGIAEAAPYLAALTPTIVLSLTASVPLALLRRRLLFGRYWAIHSFAMVVYVSVQVALAVRGWGAWAVIIGQLALCGTTFLGAFVASRYVPLFAFRLRFVREELRFAGGMLGNSALTYGVKNADYWVVGNVLGASVLGAYYLAYVLPNILAQRVVKIVDTVLVPLFARSKDDPARTRSIYVQSVRLQAGFGLPVMAGLAVIAEPIVALCFGDRWSDVVPPLRWIAVAGLFTFAGTVPSQVSLGHKLVRPIVLSQLVRVSVFVPALLAAALVWRTAEAVAVAVLVASASWFVSQQLLVAAPLGLPFRLVAPDLVAIAGATAVMSVAVMALDQSLQGSGALLRVVGGVVLGAVVYGGVGLLFFRRTYVPLLKQVVMLGTSVKRGHS